MVAEPEQNVGPDIVNSTPDNEHTDEYVCVIVVAYNSERFIERCLSAIQSQTRKPDQIVVVDNDSTDETVGLIEDKFKDIVLINAGSNLGFATANNLAIQRAPDEGFVALVNPDAFLEQHWLENMIDAAIRHPRVSGFASKLIQANSDQCLDGVGDTYHVSGLAWRKAHGEPANQAPPGEQEVFSPCAAAALYRTQDLKSVGGFDESFFCYFEDTDLGFRMRLAGFKFIYVPEAQAGHLVSASTGKHSDFAIYHGHRNLVWTFFKNMPMALLVRYLPQHILLNLVSLLVFSARGKGVIWRAKKDALLGLGRVIRQRKAIQKKNRVTNADLSQIMETSIFRPYTKRY